MLQSCFDSNFTHYRQSIRVVEVLEPLNLTEAVRDGILNHTCGVAKTLEGRVVRIADRIAYINHDIDDACRAGILDISDIPLYLREILGETHGKRIDCMVRSVIAASEEVIINAKKTEDVVRYSLSRKLRRLWRSFTVFFSSMCILIQLPRKKKDAPRRCLNSYTIIL